MPLTPARLDRVVAVTRPTVVETDVATQMLVATRLGLVLVQRERGWTWYRWGWAGRWWSATVDVAREPKQAQREAGRLIRACRARTTRGR